MAPVIVKLKTVDGILPSLEKVRTIQGFTNPTTAREVREFLKIAGYYRRYVRGFSKVARPLHGLTRQNVPFQWTLHYQKAFNKPKELLSSCPVLAYPDYTEWVYSGH